MKRIITFLFTFVYALNLLSAPKDQVSLVVMGQGSTHDAAVTSALRSAIEQSFGAFISSQTRIQNDVLVSDEIVAISSGNIKKYTILSEIHESSSYSVTVNAIVSLSKLSSFMSKNGNTCTFDGDALANNIKMMKFREENTTKCLDNLCSLLEIVYKDAFIFDVNKVENPIFCEAHSCYFFPVTISCISNNVSSDVKNMVITSMKGIALSEAEISDYDNFVGITKVPELNIVLPGKHQASILAIRKALRKCLYRVKVNADGTNHFKLLKLGTDSNFFPNPSNGFAHPDVAIVYRDDFYKKDIICSRDNDAFRGWEHLYKHIKTEYGSKDSKLICVIAPVWYESKEFNSGYRTDFYANNEFDFKRWGLKDKKNGQLVYQIKVFLTVPQDDLSAFTGVSASKTQ